MRTTLDIDNDLLQMAQELARREGRLIGKLISDPGREGLTHSLVDSSASETVSVFSFRPFPKRGVMLMNDRIDILEGRRSLLMHSPLDINFWSPFWMQTMSPTKRLFMETTMRSGKSVCPYCRAECCYRFN